MHAFSNLDKTSVLQEARVFNETPINPRKCTHILTRILYLISQGETLGRTEATEAFFAMTKLFQSKDVILRRLVYLAIKELSTIADDVIIVTSSLTKDMTGKEDNYRAPAIRALTCIVDASMVQSIERYMKQAIVDKAPAVSSAAVVSAYHMAAQGTASDVVKRWVSEAQSAVSSDNQMVQYHALGLLYHIRRADKLAVAKLLVTLTRGGLRSPHAYCFLIRMAFKQIEDDQDDNGTCFDFIESCLRHKSEMVVYEAARAIVNCKLTTQRELSPAVSVLQLFLSSPKPSLRFAAVRTLNQVAMKHPGTVTACNLDLENLITDSNRSIATLAITTLLKTGSESSVERLIKQINQFVNEISDEFKIVVVKDVRELCMKFQGKYTVFMDFLSSLLREEGGLDYKTAIVDTIINIIEEIEASKDIGLANLCEFIEDCEHTSLAVRILHLLGEEGPRASNPSKYIRFVYNRVILEAATIRAAAVTTLARFGALCEDLKPNILVLLGRICLDSDDEVRDRASFYRAVLEQDEKALNTEYILQGMQVSLSGLERALHSYTLGPCEEAFDMKSVPIDAPPAGGDGGRKDSEVSGLPGSAQKRERPTATRQEIFAEKLAAIPQMSSLGPLFKSSQSAELTEAETEYGVSCIKHVFKDHLVLQFDCLNTLNDQLLENVSISMELPEGYQELATIPCDQLPHKEPGVCYMVLKTPDDASECFETVSPLMKFTVKDCDPDTGEPDSDEGYDDEYQLEDLEIGFGDFIQRVNKTNFRNAWEDLGEENELEDTYELSAMKSLPEAVKQILQHLGMQPCERSDKVPDGKSAHQLLMAGIYRGGFEVLATAKLVLPSPEEGVTMQLTVRSENPDVSELLTQVVG